METAVVRGILDRAAILVSALCMLHCLAMPILLVVVPVLSSTLLADEWFHRFLIVVILPVSLLALLLGCRRHKDRVVLVLGGLGLAWMVLVAWLGHDLLGEVGERVATVLGGVVLVSGHVRNFRLCRRDDCDG